MRNPAAIGFYPSTRAELNDQLNDLFSSDVEDYSNALGVIVPHAGYVFSGKTAALTFKSVKNAMKDKKIFVSCPNHTGLGHPIALSNQDWQTPLGIVRHDKIISELEGQLIKADNIAHVEEHAIEVQLPFLQYLIKDFTFIPLCLQLVPFDIIEKISKTIVKKLGKKAFYVASSDFTHYGPNYGYMPRNGTVKENRKYVIKIEDRLIELIKKFKAREFFDSVTKNGYTVCGVVPITLTLLVTKAIGAKQVHIIDRRTSLDSPYGRSESFVSYAGMVIE